MSFLPLSSLTQDDVIRKGTKAERRSPPSSNTVTAPDECDETMFILTQRHYTSGPGANFSQPSDVQSSSSFQWIVALLSELRLQPTAIYSFSCRILTLDWQRNATCISTDRPRVPPNRSTNTPIGGWRISFFPHGFAFWSARVISATITVIFERFWPAFACLAARTHTMEI